MYLLLLTMYLRFQHLFRDEEEPSITYCGSPKEYIDHDKGDRGPHSPRNGCTYFSHIRNLNSLD